MDCVRAVLRRTLTGAIAIVLLLSVLRFDVPPLADIDSNLDRLLAGRQFAFPSWWAQAFGGKALDELTLWQDGMTQPQQVAFVRGYMRSVSDFQMLEGRINLVFVDSKVADKASATAKLRAERDALRASLNARQDIAEAILQEQVESTLRDEGFAIGGQVWPPVRFRFTELPDLLVVSRRDKIERIASRELQTGLTVDQQDGIERDVSQRFDVSSLVTPIGGLGAYPTMLPETSALQWTLSTVAHEWTHNYFLAMLSPIAWNYTEDAKSRIMNETTASIVQNEIGKRVAERYYPELATEITEDTEAEEIRDKRLKVPVGLEIDNALLATITSDVSPMSPMSPMSSISSPSVSSVRSVVKSAAAFDFRKEMRETRVHADELLAAGKIDEAEAYMEQRRQLFVANGHLIRKLNQAYFAFHGAYNAEPGGAPAAGRDPIGPAVQQLRKRSASLGAFVRTMAMVKSFDDLVSRLK